MKQGSQLVPSAQAAPFSAISPVGETAARCVLARAFAKQDGKAAGGTEFKASAADCAVRPGKKENFMLTVTDVSLQFAGSTLYKHVDLKFAAGNCYGIIGANGAGKSTLLRILSGALEPTTGSVTMGADDRMSVLEQDHFKYDAYNVMDTVIMGNRRLYDIMKEKEALYAKEDFTDADGEKAAELEGEFAEMNGWEAETEADQLLNGLGIPMDLHTAPMSALDGRQKVKVLLAQALFGRPSIVLLDEPTNGLDIESIDWLEQHLQQYEGTVIAVTHDRYFLDHVAGWILELDRGEGIPWKGNYSSWLEQKTKRMEQEEKTASKRRKTLERELEWVRMAPKARQAKGKARLNSYDKLLNEDVKEKEEKLEIFIPNGPRLGNKVIEAKHVAKAFGDKLLFDDLNFMLPPNGIVGIIGPNGAGKTTLFRLIMGLEKADKGEFEVGETVKVAYVDQQHKDIDPNKSVYQVISGGNDLIRMGGRDINARAYLSRFNFSGADQEKLCGVLSGGERNRLHLALCLKEEGNVLLLDEPTNDIDVNTLRALEEGLEDFAGCAVVISHDRWFLDRICTHILAFEGDSNVFFFEGSYSEYEENKQKRLGKEEPTRVRYRKLMND